ncbi:hypothetical protein PHK61_25970 [Actinomycetospora lutea]|nr:hypothetical protein [Actinomycetospora lutea]MDD7941869.1 hypothetical protein [Actinomycetospora lutea]
MEAAARLEGLEEGIEARDGALAQLERAQGGEDRAVEVIGV